MAALGPVLRPFVPLEEVEACQAPNDTWLSFFGHQHEAYDFLTRPKSNDGLKMPARWIEPTSLGPVIKSKRCTFRTRSSKAPKKLWAWLERGARIYVRGDAEGMAPGVASAFKAVATKQGGIHDADAWLQQLVGQALVQNRRLLKRQQLTICLNIDDRHHCGRWRFCFNDRG